MPSHGSVIRVFQSLQGGIGPKNMFFFVFEGSGCPNLHGGWLVESLENGKTNMEFPKMTAIIRPAAARPAISWLAGWAFGEGCAP